MAMRGGPRLQVGSAAWVAEERDSALTIAQSEIEEFSFSARNEIDWLNEHMADIFSENQMNVAELFKTPGKLRGKTPRTARKAEHSSIRVPLSDMFSATPKGAPNPFTIPNLALARSPKIQVAEDKSDAAAACPESPANPAVVHPPHRVESRAPISLADSGYHGSQSQDTLPFDHFDKDIEMSDSPQRDLHTSDPDLRYSSEPAGERRHSTISVDEPFEAADENQARQATSVTTNVAPTPSSAIVQQSSPFARTRLPMMSPRSPSPNKISSPVRDPQKSSSPHKLSPPQKTSTSKGGPASPHIGFPKPREDLLEPVNGRDSEGEDEAEDDEARSASDASSPIRPIVRKSSLNFASLPAREPLASKKSLGGARMSRTSHLDFNRQSYFNRHTGGKSLGNAMRQESSEDDHNDEMDVDDDMAGQQEDATAYSKTYTQRLQDQISMLGKGQSMGPRPSKSLANVLPSQQSASSQNQSQVEAAPEAVKPSSKPKQSVPGPGAFPEDDEDDWIAAPRTSATPDVPMAAPLAAYPSHVAEDLAKRPVSGSEFVLPKSRPVSPGKAPYMPERSPKHAKSASVPVFPTMVQLDAEMADSPLKKTISVSNPGLSSVAEDDFASPPKSPTRSFRESPLKQVKNKLSSLLKSSKGLMASGAALSAESKSSLLQSPSTTTLGYHPGPSIESFKTADTVMYPDLSQQLSATSAPLSPVRSNSSRMEKQEEKERKKEKEKEIKHAKRMAEEMEKLEKVREKEREKAHVFTKEQERIAAMERQVATQKEQESAAETQARPQSQAFRTPGPAPKNVLRSPTKTRPTPRITKGQSEQEGRKAAIPSDELDMEMADATTTVPPPSIPRPTTASSMRIPGPKRPIKPTKEALVKSKKLPTVMRVNVPSSHQTFQPSNSVLGANLHDTLSQPPGSARQVGAKASQAPLHGKSSRDNLKASVTSTGRPRALDVAAKRKEQEERDAQRRRATKQENDRKRAAQEEERREQQRKEEADRLKEEAERKKRADIEKAKQTGAPPPAARSQPNGPPEYSKPEKGTLRPPSRLDSVMHQEGRLVNANLLSTSKGPLKRPLPHDAGEESSRSQQQRALPSFQTKPGKSMRVSEEFDEDLDMMDSHNPRTIKGAPVRPSGGFKKELPVKSVYGNGYSNAPPPSASKNLFKTAVSAQHNSHAKTAHALDTAQFSKGAIPFAPNPNQAAPAHYKTPGRQVGGPIPKASAKSAARSSPRFQNGEAIELPDIDTDDDSDEDDGHMAVAAWAESDALTAALHAQERVDPLHVFGPPVPLDMEKVFNKTKDRWNKFRARTSSANWSGTDRLTEEDVRKDMAARDKMRREGGWSYEMSREMS